MSTRGLVPIGAQIGALAITIALAACKPPPTDAGLNRDMPASEPTFASEPLPSPDTEGAVWAQSTEANRIIYGIPGQPALISLVCEHRDGQSELLRITRISPADEGAGALLAMVGNGAIGRLEVDATKIGSQIVWQGEAPAADTVWEPLSGPRQVTVTVPGAGMVTLNPGDATRLFVERCRGIEPEYDEEPDATAEPARSEDPA